MNRSNKQRRQPAPLFLYAAAWLGRHTRRIKGYVMASGEPEDLSRTISDSTGIRPPGEA